MHFLDYTLTPDTKRILLYMGISVGCLFTLFGIFLSRTKSAVKPYLKSFLIYALVYALVFALLTWLAASAILFNYTRLFIVLQLILLGLGIVNRYTLPKYMKWHDDNTFWLDILFSSAVAALGAIAFILLFRTVNQEGMEWYLCAAFLTFIIPLIILQTFRKATEIPPKIFKLWYYPAHQDEEHFPDEKLLKNMLVISFEFKKNENDLHYTNFRAKAPVDMGIGDLFYYFINDYNLRHPQSKIVYNNLQTGSPNGWLFYKKPKWYSLLTKYIDADKTTFINNIKENDIIVCHRNF